MSTTTGREALPRQTSTAPDGRPRAESARSSAGAWRVVAAREVLVKLRDKVFIGSFVFLLVATLAGVVLSAVLGGRTSTDEVAVVAGEQRSAAVVERAQDLLAATSDGDRVVAREVPSTARAEALVRSGDVDAALVAAPGQTAGGAEGVVALQVVGDEELDTALVDLLSRASQADALERNAQAAGTSVEELFAGTELTQRLLEPSQIDPVLEYVLPFVFAILFFVLAIQFGMAIAQSVVEEKQSRVVEILAAAVPIRALLVGKVVANGALALAQVVLIGVVGVVGLAVTGQGEVLSLVTAPVAWFVLFFVLGFVALACVWAVAGSVATRSEDLQATTTPLTMLLLGAFYLGIFASGWLLTVASYVPIVSTVAMPTRLATGDAAWWEPVLSVLLVVLVAVVLVRLGAHLYERSLLRTDRRSSVRELLRERG